MLWSIDALFEKWCENETQTLEMEKKKKRKRKKINRIQCLGSKQKPVWLMLKEYDARKHTRVYNAAMLAADFSEWLYIK